MLTISFVNFLQIALLTLTLFGIVLLITYHQYRQICMLLALVAIASIFNLLEELNITRNLYLVTPVFVIGFGPAIYLAINGLLGDKLKWSCLWHFMPMLIALPFTHYPELVIAIGTLWRIIYAFLSLNRLFNFHKFIVQQRSDAQELSLNWLVWSLAIMTFVSTLNLIRLNLQPIISYTENLVGQGVSTAVSLLFFMLFIRQLIHQKDAFLSLITERTVEVKTDSSTQVHIANSAETSQVDHEHFNQIFEFISKEIVSKGWYKVPRLTLSHLSELSGLQSRDISRAINIVSEKNFNDYINQLRLEEVIRHIEKSPTEALLNLAIEAGFNSKSAFNQAFKRHYSMTPMEFRNSKKG